MTFTVTRLCGGKALMAADNDPIDIDLDHAADILKDEFTVKKNEDGMMLVMEWKGMEVTLYPQGKVMFFPLSDKNQSVEYATYIINKFR